VFRRFVLGCAALVTLSSAAAAQRTARLGIGFNGALPVGTYADRHRSGPGFLGAITFAGNENSILGLRIDGSDTKINGKTVAGGEVPAYNIVSVTGNIVATANGEQFKPYALAGGGWYTYRDSVTTDKRQNRFGVQGGVGVTFSFILTSAFLEVRYHRIFENDMRRRYVALTAGLVI